ncbi:hypothetical protein BTO05_10115 [Winogradskyella sp. PC-19]|uniref:hypothetical protein n=1 Tax=unclassified Winogradskyella TaxID=2615021 RepID=UPI000B3BF491|nr:MULTISPECIES: hypothetical protein [unclassified Winogradskyella]ARV09973.1 hypothetical protein BTO05_10115 [Winogradskyella sp. PC-19]
MNNSEIRDLFLKLPKADVHSHLHLAGSQKRFKEKYPEANLTFPKSFDGLTGMIDFIYGHLNTIMVEGEDVINFMEIAIESAIDDNVTLLEASVDLNLSRFFDGKIEKVIEITKHLKEKYESQIDFKPELGINKDLEYEKVYNDGIKCIESGVFHSVDLYGQEVGKDLKPFVRFYDMAKDLGLKRKVHIGEFSDYESIDYTIKLLSPDELQHGLRAVDSERTMDSILENNIRLNICPTSNVLLGAVSNIEKHTIRQLFDHGIKVTVNTDDLILFDASVTDEFVKLAEAGIFTMEELHTIRKNGF